MKTRRISFRNITFSVDRENGVLSNLSLLTGDCEAKGHGLYIDQKTVESAFESCPKGGKLKAYITHGSYEGYRKNGGDRVMEIPGYFSGISVKGNQLVAESFVFFDAFKKYNPEAFETLMEMAEKTPELFGISIEPTGYAVFVATDGKEYSTDENVPSGKSLKYGGMPAFRVTELDAAAFVSEPAANSGGLLAAFSRLFGKQTDQERVLSILREAIEEASKETLSTDKPVDSKPVTSTTMIATLKAKYGADKARLQRALVAHVEDESLTAEQIDAKLSAEDSATELANLKAEVNTLKADLAKANDSLKAANDAKTKIEADLAAVKNSGHQGKVDLGAGGAGTPTTTVNPWKRGSTNYTERARLSRENPELAKVLKAQAEEEDGKEPQFIEGDVD